MTKYNLIYRNGVSKIQQHHLLTLNKEFLYQNLNINMETGTLEEAAETMANRNSYQY
jgi:hypothetical protein